MRYLKDYDTIYNQIREKEVNEGFKNWLSTFLIMAGLGLVPPSIAQGQNKQQQKEFVENQDKNKVDGALFIDYLNKYGLNGGLEETFNKFKSISNGNVKSNFKDVNKYVSRNGKQYNFSQSYIQHDYSGVDISKFQPDNYLVDMGNMIDDEKESYINNIISEYEKQSTVEILVITIPKLPEGKLIEDYALDQFRRIKVGKKGADNGIVIAFSKEDRKMNITTGYGVEGVLPDITCKEILDKIIVPKFKEEDYYGGIIDGLEQIKSIIGTDLNAKKEWIRLKKDADDRESAEFWSTFGDVSAISLILLLILGSITYGIYKTKKKMREAKEMREYIDEIISKIENLKSIIPVKSELGGSQNLDSLLNYCKKFISDKPIESKYDDENKENLKQIYSKMSSLYGNYKTKHDELKRFKSSLEDINSVESSAFGSIEEAINKAKKISEYGYEAREIPNRSEVDDLHVLIPKILSMVTTDIDGASVLYKKYISGISNITSKGGNISKTLSSIEGAISRIKNWKSEVDNFMPKFKTASGNVGELNSMINAFTSKVSGSKDWIGLVKELDKVIAFMKGEIKKYEDEQDRIRRKREEEEEERRRKRRREEEEAESRRRSSKSSSSSSGSSFGGFGGGSSGGGGASSGW